MKRQGLSILALFKGQTYTYDGLNRLITVDYPPSDKKPLFMTPQATE